MTEFENYLISIGYIRYKLNTKTWQFELDKYYDLSTLSNICYYYIHSNNTSVIDKISSGVKLGSDGLVWDNIKAICFGLNEVGKPSTLINPRPRIKVIRDSGFYNNQFDDSMNIVLKNYSPSEIYEAIFDTTKQFEINLT